MGSQTCRKLNQVGQIAAEVFLAFPLVLVIALFATGYGQKLLQNYKHDTEDIAKEDFEYQRAEEKMKQVTKNLIEVNGFEKTIKNYVALGWVFKASVGSGSNKFVILQKDEKEIVLGKTYGVISCLKKLGCD